MRRALAQKDGGVSFDHLWLLWRDLNHQRNERFSAGCLRAALAEGQGTREPKGAVRIACRGRLREKLLDRSLRSGVVASSELCRYELVAYFRVPWLVAECGR